MTKKLIIKPTQKPVREYYASLEQLRQQQATSELSIRSAFQNLLSDCARMQKWTLIPEYKDRALGHIIRPDGTVKDRNSIPRGYWEAKGENDDLDLETAKKIELGYPLKNTIFENSRRAILFQDDIEILRIDLDKPVELIRLLEAFFNYSAPDYENYETAIEKFKGEIPELAVSLTHKVREAHESNHEFKRTFSGLFDLCKSSLNRDIRRDAVDEMLIQHILTERIIRTVFDNPYFMSQNVIAVEIEKTIEALTGEQFDRVEFLRNLNPFYKAIEDAARSIHYYNDKLYLLNHVYERFFQGFCVRTADTHGIIYTPQEIVNFICASIEGALDREFGKSLGDPEVQILDPATGTGSFLVNLLNRTPVNVLDRLYEEQIFANEVMLMPYYIASLNIEHTYFERTGRYKPFGGLCFVDTLDLATQEPVGKNHRFRFTEENTKRIERQLTAPITVILGNPPYNAHQINENDNNKNRRYAILDKHLKETYVRDSSATNKNSLYDAYVRFFRWATDRLEGRSGLVCFISNNNFAHDYAFDGMRKHLKQDFTDIYHLDLGGNYRKGEGGDNVFGIKPGVGITLAIINSGKSEHRIFYHRLPKMRRREEKLKRLNEVGSYGDIQWHQILTDKRHDWFPPDKEAVFKSLLPVGRSDVRQKKMIDAKVIFLQYGSGVKTNRDNTVYDFNREKLTTRIRDTIENYNTVVDKYKRSKIPKDEVDKYIDNFCEKEKHIEWSESLKKKMSRGIFAEYDESCIRTAFYRPFTKRYIYFDSMLDERRYQFPNFFPDEKTEKENVVISQLCYGRSPFCVFAANIIVDVAFFIEPNQCYPLYTYNKKGVRKENVSATALRLFRKQYADLSITREDVFYYVYGLLNHPGYREKFSDNLKRDLPRIPFAPDFRAFSETGRQLAEIHLNYETIEPYPFKWIETPKVKPNWRVARMKIVDDAVIVNEWLTLKGLPPEVSEYRLGNRSALEWVVDQYRIKEDKRTGIISDPNRSDEPQYIARLIEKIVRVSVETVRLVKGLPDKWM